MFFKQIINKIKLLHKDKESYPDLVWLEKDQESLRQFMIRNPANVRKEEPASLKIVEKVNFTKLNAQEARQFAFLGLKLKPMPIIIPILIAAILAGGGVTAVQAQDSLPGQVLYPVKLVTEQVQLVFSSDEGDVQLHAKFASKRAGELEELISQIQEQGVEAVEIKTALIEDTASKLKQEVELSEKGLAALAEKDKDVTELALKVEEATNNHLEVLAGLIAKVPAETQPAIEQAYRVSQNGQASAMGAVIQAGEKGYSETVKPLVEERINVRLEEAKSKVEHFNKAILQGSIVNDQQVSKPLPEEKQPIPLMIEGKIKQVDQSIQQSETSLKQGDLVETLKGIQEINVQINEIETSTSIAPSPDANEQSYIYPTDIEEVKTGGILTLEGAAKIALSNPECVQYGLDTKSGSYNKNSNTWWFNLKYKTDVCDYACVVYGLDQDKRSEVYPMCRGLVVPDNEYNECEQLTGHSVKAYQDGWKEAFKKENKLSEAQFNTYITVTDVTLQSIGNTCELTVRYAVKKDWVSVNRADNMILGVPPAISPNNLPLESDPTKSGRTGVSTINFHDSLSFKNKTEALNYFVNAYDLSGTDAGIQKENFQYFWDKESAENSNYPFAGEGGEAYITVVGTINAAQNKCYRGQLSLVSKETTYRETPCFIN